MRFTRIAGVRSGSIRIRCNRIPISCFAERFISCTYIGKGREIQRCGVRCRSS